jgi:hypothetical protein
MQKVQEYQHSPELSMTETNGFIVSEFTDLLSVAFLGMTNSALWLLPVANPRDNPPHVTAYP